MATVRYTVIDGELIAEKRGGVRSLYVPDPLGSTVALLDNTQTKTDTFNYWPYGEVKSRTGTTATPFQYVGTQGCYQDTSTQIQMRARIQKPNYGRFLTEDPIGFEGEDANLYRYVSNRPTTWTDPTGLECRMEPPKQNPAKPVPPGRFPGDPGKQSPVWDILKPNPKDNKCMKKYKKDMISCIFQGAVCQLLDLENCELKYDLCTANAWAEYWRCQYGELQGQYGKLQGQYGKLQDLHDKLQKLIDKIIKDDEKFFKKIKEISK